MGTSGGPMVSCCQGAHSWAVSSGHLYSLWRFDYVSGPSPLGGVMHPSWCLWLSILHSSLALETPPLPPPCQYYLWAHLPYFSGTRIKVGTAPPPPRYPLVPSSCSLYPLPLWFLISLYLVYLLIYSFVYSTVFIKYLLWVRHLLKVVSRWICFCLDGAHKSSRENRQYGTSSKTEI